MTRRHELLFALNAGGVDPEAIARIDLEKSRIAAEHPMSNLLPRVLGPATLRPGTEMRTRLTGDAATRLLPFDNEDGDRYLLALSASELRIILAGTIQQVPNVATVIASGSWSDVSTAPAAATGGASLSLTATAEKPAKLRQTVSVSGTDDETTHILRVVVGLGPVTLRVGSTAGGQEVLEDVSLDSGTHKVGFVPGNGVTNIYVEVRSDDPVTRTVSSIQFEWTALGSGNKDLVLPTPWSTIAQIEALRIWQSEDTVFVGSSVQQRRIEHRGALSWGIALYKTDDGPFTPGQRQTTMTPAALSGNTTITASDGYFLAGHVGALIELTQTGKNVATTLGSLAATSDYITVIGVSTGRNFTFQSTGTGFTGSVVVERSFDIDEPVSWSTYLTYTDGAATFALQTDNDGLSNSTVHYRFRMSVYTAGSVAVTLAYDSDVQIGRARITDLNSATNVDVEVLETFGNTRATKTWRIGAWSDVRGWPRVPVIHDDRMHWFGDYDYAAKVSDYYVYDDGGEGDSEPFTRSVGKVLWAVSTSRLLAGTPSAEAVVAASELDEPLTPTKYTVRTPSQRGCADIPPAEHDEGVFFVQRSGRRLYEMSTGEGGRFRSQDVSRLNPAAYKAGIRRLAVQQQPDTRCHALLTGGQIVTLTYERDDKVAAVTTMDIAGGTVEDICVLADDDQDDVHLIVNRGGQRYLETLAKEADQRAVATCGLLDGHTVLTGSVSAISGATRFASQTVQVWADGARRADVALNASGNGSLGATYGRVVYGKRYTATFNSVKLGFAGGLGTALGQTKIVRGASVVLSNSCLDGVRIGRDATHTDPMPAKVNGAVRTASQFFTHYDADIFPIPADWNTDARFYLTVDSAEGPCTVQAVVLDIETRDGAERGG